ncbi:MAG: GH92 family glycosyl hydrolase [Bacteroidia bacterium]|nr:GH92 family glycosyl hydrolase [Bacteroidia bacterium]NND25017.1 glycoside hydrolase family 92 protein [Flavobacteriaceae bacterium]MBT8278563.1 GH92 family glycosyl hydrolase [Bacteroidia bacterium]NNK59543.1 glycoside hydrolase family 92 protein [Flavobacteriaceae bacterium]NNL32492.1 glycoside hydrolase family 92 protein [Flavobacteriaceae bacterium]
MKLYPFFIFLIIISVSGCLSSTDKTPAQKDQQLISYVNPFIGTGGHGHTYPGATMPFGMMQLSPDTRLDGWDGCSGYHYSDDYIYGFSHTHLSGTGVSDYGDILLMPTNEIVFNNGSDGKKGYRDHFSHDNEIAEPGFYKVHLDSTNIDVELTVSKRSGMHKYQFPSAENQVVILDLIHRDKVLDAKIEKISDTEIQGYRFSDAWATDQRLFFYFKTSHPFTDMLQSPPKYGMPGGRKTALTFINPNNEPVYIKIGISAVDVAGAKKNLEAEIADKSFEQVKKEAQDLWEKQLEKIIIESDNLDYKTNFYTALYHTMLAPNLYQDVDGKYRGMDLNIHQTTAFDYYTVFSLWDTYRAAHPLYTIIEQERTNDFIKTFISKYQEGGIMPIWDLSANYTGCMIGYHAVPVIADAYLKGIKNYDVEKAFEAMKHSASQNKLGLESYKKYGFIPVEEESESVSKTLEYAYDDWTIAQMAKSLGKSDDYKYYLQRAQNYKNVFDPETQFMRGRFRNTWFSPFDPYEVNFNYTEANAWQYSYYVPQDVSGFMNLLGGKKQLIAHLDKLFTAEAETSGRDQADITGLIGQYAHGNEPSHHMAYLYNYAGRPDKTMEKVHKILTELYQNAPDGISGNEDCGQMSAWYVFSSLGFYPVTPGSNDYIIGTPLFKKATINLESGKQFTINAHNLSSTHIYIESARLNNSKLESTFITHEDIMNGGVLDFYMTDNPAIWGSREGSEPISSIDEQLIVPMPYIAEGQVAFKGETEVVLKNSDKEALIFYQLNDQEFKQYQEPIKIKEPLELSVYSEKNGVKSATMTTQFYKIDPNISITLETEYANQYNAGGNDALIDGILGTLDFRTGTWQGYWDEDLIATIDLGSIKPISNVSVNFLQDQRSWIFYPTEVSCFVSTDGINFKLSEKVLINSTLQSENSEIKTISFKQDPTNGRYIKIIAKKLGVLPVWHLGYEHDGRSWIFVDEIRIN